MIYIEVNMMEIEKWLNDVLEKKNKRGRVRRREAPEREKTKEKR